MKKILVSAFTLFTMAACQSNSAPAEEQAADMPMESTPTEAVIASAEIDPVCKMEREDTWTEYAVSGSDTIWFCSQTCKSAFEANPTHYQTP